MPWSPHFLPRRLRRDRRGIAAVEFALAAPVLGFLMLAMVDLARSISQALPLRTAVRAGLEYASALPEDLDGIKRAVETALMVRGALPRGITVPQPSLVTAPCGAGDTTCSGQMVFIKIRATRSFQPVLISTIKTLEGNVQTRIR